MHLATVDGKHLTKVLRRMKRIRGKKMGAAFWRFEEGIIIDWAGMEIGVEGEVVSPLPHGIIVPGRFMKHATVKLRYSGPTEIHWQNNQFHLGPDRVVAEQANAPRVFALPIDAREVHVLRALRSHSASTIRQSGYGNELDAAKARLDRTVDKMEKTLSWIGIDRLEIVLFLKDKIIGTSEQSAHCG